MGLAWEEMCRTHWSVSCDGEFFCEQRPKGGTMWGQGWASYLVQAGGAGLAGGIRGEGRQRVREQSCRLARNLSLATENRLPP